MFNYNHLYYFYTTAKLGGVSNAAKFLRISQPSLSAQIKTLEQSLAKKLFEKNGRKMQLTDQGEQVYTYCRRIFEMAEHLSDYLKSPSQNETRRLNIGVSDQIERPFVADLLGNILVQPTTQTRSVLNVSTGTDAELVQQLKDQDIDLVISNKSIYADDLVEIISTKKPVALVISKDLIKKFGYSKNPTLAEIFKNDQIGLLMPSEKMRLRHETDVFIQQKNLKKPTIMESDILSVVARAAVDGVGCAFLPIPYVYKELKMKLLTVVGPSDGYWLHRLSLIARKQIEYDPIIEEIKSNLLEFSKVV